MNEEELRKKQAFEKQKLSELVAELERQRTTAQKYDVVIPGELLKVSVDVGTTTVVLEVPQPDDGKTSEFEIKRHELNDVAHEQLAGAVGIERGYYNKMRARNELQLLSDNVNTWLPDKKKQLVRVLDGKVRAVLGSRYRVIDNYDVFYYALDELKKLSDERGITVDIKQARLTDGRLYMKVVSPELSNFVKHYNGKEERIEVGIIISNSEVGWGAFYVKPFINVVVCSNGLVRPLIDDKEFRKVHSGKELPVGFIDWSDETRRLEDELLFSRIRDMIRKTFDMETLAAWIDEINDVAGNEFLKPEKAVDHIIKTYGIPKNRKEALLNQFIREGSPTQWGLAMAVTRIAQDEKSYDMQVEYERIGGKILEKKIIIEEED